VSETRIHPETGKVLRRDVRPQTVVVGSLSRTVDVPGWYPDDESDGVHSGADLKALLQQAALESMVRRDGKAHAHDGITRADVECALHHR